MKNTLRIVAQDGAVFRNARELKKRIKSSLVKDKSVKEGKYDLVNHNGEVIGTVNYERVANGNYTGTKGKVKGHGRRRQRLKNSGTKYKVVGKFTAAKA